MIFKYHSGLRAIVMTIEATAEVQVVMLIQTKAARASGWFFDDEGLARSLPRSEIRFGSVPPFGVPLRYATPPPPPAVQFVPDSRYPDPLQR